ncbi:MCE family protein [Antrihabitans sp. YC3-6]|uniref:MCE family protein n=1 Tax=Antrihabitans stalagmiti TaxID=2799499 RepID=A0A934NVN7_9NOCA|nr:MlaD family protein [Antrihabitans stalagmiti]MBJ8342132.1 MCE family protein [Antrihabitans stalagmiti]
MTTKLGSIISLTALATVLIVGLGYLTFGVVRVEWFKDYTTATMVLTNSGSLGPDSPVLLSGVEVGDVTSIDNVADGVRVEFRVEDKFDIPIASTVLIENLSALGEPYVQFTPTTGDGPYLQSGQQIDTRTIQMPLSIPDVASTVTNLMNQLDPEAISSIVDTFSQALAGLENVVPDLARSTSLLAATILSRTPEVRGLLTDLQAIGSDMEWTGPSMASAGPLWADFGVKVEMVVESLAKFVRLPGVPDSYITGNGIVPFLPKLTAYFEEVGPDLEVLVPVIQPLAATATASIPAIDLSSLIAQALSTTADDGAIHLQINVK